MQLLPMDAKLSPALAALYDETPDDFSTGQSAGFPVISIKGKVFHIKRGDERELVMKPGDDEEPAASLEVVVIATHAGVAKTYYSTGYVEGSAEKPDCYSNDGIAPAEDSIDRQAKKCAVCPHNQWGARITDDGKKAKNCADVKRLAVAPAGQLNDPMLLRLPATTLAVWDQYVSLLGKSGKKPPMVVTKVGFDYSVAHPALTFKAVGMVTEQMAGQVRDIKGEDIVRNIIGAVSDVPVTTDRSPQATPSKALSKAVEEAEAAVAARPGKPKPKVRVEDDDDDGEADAPPPKPAAKPAKAAPKAKPKVRVEDDEDDEGAPAAEKKASAVVGDDSLIEGLDEMLGELGFDG